MKRYGVGPSVCPLALRYGPVGPTAANPLLQVCCCGLGGQDVSFNCYSSGMRRANAGSASLAAYVGS